MVYTDQHRYHRLMVRTNLRILARLEERCHANETCVVVPDDEVLLVLAGHLVDILEDCGLVNSRFPQMADYINLRRPCDQSCYQSLSSFRRRKGCVASLS